MLLLTTPEVSFFTSSICIFAILTIIVLNVSTSNVQTNCFRSISQKFGKVLNSLHSFTLFLLFGILTHLTMVVTLVVILFIALIFNMHIKLVL